ncbi:hypothetical protein Btru_000001 [Bulinus truncatus]|nr:hypothetical protein Btru_000001 [Bulinus truncatus]
MNDIKISEFPSCVSLSIPAVSKGTDYTEMKFSVKDCNKRSINVLICERDLLKNWTSFDRINHFQLNASIEIPNVDQEFLFDCQDNGQFVPYTKVCDGDLNCDSRLDETFCNYKNHKQFHKKKCKDFQCKTYNEQFGSLLKNAYSSVKEQCLESLCHEGSCLPAQWVKSEDCYLTFHDDPGVFCIDFDCSRTSEIVFCDVNSVETKIKYKCSDQNTSRCLVDENINWAPKCIYLRGRSGYALGCPDLSHLENCENFTCPDDMVKCPLSYCIQLHYVGDEIMDCRYGEDESFLVHVGNDEIKECLLNAQPGEIIRYCDLNIDCDNAADESHCHISCPDSFKCPNTSPDVCHSPRDAISSCDDLLADKTKRVLLWIVASVSFIGNVAVLSYRYLIDRDILKLSYGVFIINLGISDFIMSIYLIIIAAVDIYYRDVYVLYERKWRFSPLCKAAGFLSTLSSETSTFFVLLVTIDRFLAIRFPFGNYRFSKSNVVSSVILVWTVGFVVALIPILLPDVAIYSSNGMCLGLPLYYNQEPGWMYAMSIFIILNFIIFTLVATGQAAIYIAATTSNKSFVQNQLRRKKDIDVARQLCLIAMSNFLCWFPVSLIGLLSMTGSSVSLETYAWIVVFVLPLNSAVNPNIYTIPFV